MIVTTSNETRYDVTGPAEPRQFSCLWPPIRKTHPNLFTLISAQVWLHIGFGLSALFGTHTSSAWKYFGTWGFTIVGVVHLAIAVLIVYGLHFNWAVARSGFLASVTLYLMQVCLFIAGIYHAISASVPVTYEGAVYSAGLVFISISIYRESVSPHPYFGLE